MASPWDPPLGSSWLKTICPEVKWFTFILDQRIMSSPGKFIFLVMCSRNIFNKVTPGKRTHILAKLLAGCFSGKEEAELDV